MFYFCINHIGNPVLIISSAYLVSGHLLIGCLSILIKSLFLGSSTLKPTDWLKVRGTLYLSSKLLPILICLNLSDLIYSYDLYSLPQSFLASKLALILVKAALNSSKDTFPSLLASNSSMNILISSSRAGYPKVS